MGRDGRKAESWPLDAHQVSVSHLNKLYWPDDGLTKGDLLAYYRDLAPAIVPHFTGRPVTLRVFPNGIGGSSYYRRERPAEAPSCLRGVDYRPRSATRASRLMVIDDVAGLDWLANQGTIEFHLWSSRIPDLSEPDQAIFDLDPGEGVGFADVLSAARILRRKLDQLGLNGYPKTSGRRGIHVYVPLAPGHVFDQVRAWVKVVAMQLAAENPAVFAITRGPTHRGQLVTIDYAQNSIGRNTAAPYTVRALPHAPVSAPLTWQEVEEGKIRPLNLTLKTMRARLDSLGDPFVPTTACIQRLPD